MTLTTALPVGPLQLQDFFPGGSRVDVFSDIYWAFLVLGTLVGIVVIAYMLYNAYKYRDDGTRDEKEDEDRPELGELPEGGGKGKKLFLSFSLSAIIVISLILWTYAMLLYVETTATGAQAQPQVQGDNVMTIDVEGYQFGWTFIYPNGHESTTLRIPEEKRIRLNVTSRDVIHNFGIPAFRAKTDAIPGQTTETWFIANETGTFQAQCYELCGAGHSYMTAEVRVMNQSAYQAWYENTSAPSSGGNATSAEVAP